MPSSPLRVLDQKTVNENKAESAGRLAGGSAGRSAGRLNAPDAKPSAVVNYLTPGRNPTGKPLRERCDRRGAEATARQIERYWAERGYAVTCELTQKPFCGEMRIARYDIRSDLVDGWPTRTLADKRRRA